MPKLNGSQKITIAWINGYYMFLVSKLEKEVSSGAGVYNSLI